MSDEGAGVAGWRCSCAAFRIQEWRFPRRSSWPSHTTLNPRARSAPSHSLLLFEFVTDPRPRHAGDFVAGGAVLGHLVRGNLALRVEEVQAGQGFSKGSAGVRKELGRNAGVDRVAPFE